MNGLPTGTNIYLCTQPVDFRKGFDGLTGVVTAALGHNVTDWESLAPHAWKAEHPESLRTYRQDERRQAADRKRVRRARRRKLKK